MERLELLAPESCESQTDQQTPRSFRAQGSIDQVTHAASLAQWTRPFAFGRPEQLRLEIFQRRRQVGLRGEIPKRTWGACWLQRDSAEGRLR